MKIFFLSKAKRFRLACIYLGIISMPLSVMGQNGAHNTKSEAISRKLNELQTPEKWTGKGKSESDILKNAEAERTASKRCQPGTPNLKPEDLATILVEGEDLKRNIAKQHANFLNKKLNHAEAVSIFKDLRPKGEGLKLFYNTKISKHCARGARMQAGLNDAKKHTEEVVNLLNNFVKDLNDPIFK